MKEKKNFLEGRRGGKGPYLCFFGFFHCYCALSLPKAHCNHSDGGGLPLRSLSLVVRERCDNGASDGRQQSLTQQERWQVMDNRLSYTIFSRVILKAFRLHLPRCLLMVFITLVQTSQKILSYM